jgi:hypothetical protein
MQQRARSGLLPVALKVFCFSTRLSAHRVSTDSTCHCREEIGVVNTVHATEFP